MNILFLTFYFKPDLCAGSFRNSSLLMELARLLEPKDTIHVISTLPNRYESYHESAPTHEFFGNVQVDRVSTPKHRSGFIDQALAFKAFFFGTLKIVRRNNYDLVYASSSRLFTAFLGALISRKKKIPLYLDIRDIFVDTINEIVKSRIVSIPITKLFKAIERFTIRSASHINLISEGFRPYFFEYKQKNISFFTNGIDEEFLSVNCTLPKESSIVITYAGNIGDGQGLHHIIPQAAAQLYPKYSFRVIGDGGKKDDLLKSLKRQGVKNVELIPPVSRDKIIQYYENTHYLFLHLNKYVAFEKVLPSKIFEYGAIGKPIIAGVSGYAEVFIKENLNNYILFSPGNVQEMVSGLNRHRFYMEDPKVFCKKFSRKSINHLMAKSILNAI